MAGAELSPAELLAASKAWLEANPDAPLTNRVALTVVVLAEGRLEAQVVLADVIAELGESENNVKAAIAAINDADELALMLPLGR